MNPSTFPELGCAEPFLSALQRRGYTHPTPVQEHCFQAGLEGRDLLVQSRTGSGKTLAFGLPLMHRLSGERHPQALVLTPTRELAQQVAGELQSVMPRLVIAQLVGGMGYAAQVSALRQGAPVIVGTPGRVQDHLERGTLDLARVTMVVLDECDEMLNMGFIEDVERILSQAPAERQTYLFSATLPAPIASLARRFLKEPHRVQLGEQGGVTQHADIVHTPCLVAEPLQIRALVNFLLLDEPSSALIFSKRRHDAEEIAAALQDAGLAAEYLHGDLAQNVRSRIMGAFKEGKLRYLVATDVAARGIDIENMPLVVHMGIPMQFENYIHRSGRTGRAGAKGASLAMVGYRESRILAAWANRGGLKLSWRGVPTRDEIREARSARLAARVRAPEAPERFMELARSLVTEVDPVRLVATLLSMIEDESHDGYDLPDQPRFEPARAPAPAQRPWTPRYHQNGAQGAPRRQDERAGGYRKPKAGPRPRAGR
jgi:ATP-dependent RNA helicase DeaD